MPMSIAWPVGATLAGRWLYKVGAKRTFVIGSILVVLSSAWLLAIELHSPYWYFVGIMIVMGYGMGWVVTPATVTIQTAVGWQMRGAATGSNQLARSLGQTIGVTIYGSLFNTDVMHYAAQHPGSGITQRQLSGLLDAVSGGGASTTNLPGTVRTFVDQTLAYALHHIFVWMFAVAALAFVISWWLPSHKRILEQQKQVA